MKIKDLENLEQKIEKNKNNKKVLSKLYFKIPRTYSDIEKAFGRENRINNPKEFVLFENKCDELYNLTINYLKEFIEELVI